MIVKSECLLTSVRGIVGQMSGYSVGGSKYELNAWEERSIGGYYSRS